MAMELKLIEAIKTDIEMLLLDIRREQGKHSTILNSGRDYGLVEALKIIEKHEESITEDVGEEGFCATCHQLPCICCGNCDDYPCKCEHLEEKEAETYGSIEIIP